VQKEYHKLIELTGELVGALEASVQGEVVSGHLLGVPFMSQMSDDYLQEISSRLIEANLAMQSLAAVDGGDTRENSSNNLIVPRVRAPQIDPDLE
jgi:hypothetical protein